MKKKSKKRRKGVRRKKVNELTAREKTKLKTIHQRRSKRARSLDEKYAAKTPVYVSTWIRNPGKYDIPGIDMGKQRKKSVTKFERELRKTIKEKKPEWAVGFIVEARKIVKQGKVVGFEYVGYPLKKGKEKETYYTRSSWNPRKLVQVPKPERKEDYIPLMRAVGKYVVKGGKVVKVKLRKIKEYGPWYDIREIYEEQK